MDSFGLIKDNLLYVKGISGKANKMEALRTVCSESPHTNEVVRFLLDDFKKTGLKKAKLNKELNLEGQDGLGKFDFLFPQWIDYVVKNNTGSNAVISNIQATMKFYLDGGSMTQSDVDFFYEILAKTFKLGLSADSYNTVFPNQPIDTFGVQLAKPFTLKNADDFEKNNTSFTITNKFNGNRCLAVVSNLGDVSFFTRKGFEMTGLELLVEEFKTFPHGYAYDMEITKDLSEVDDLDEAFRQVNGELNSKDKNLDIHAQVFDMITLEDFDKGVSEATYQERRTRLDTVFYDHKPNRVHIVPVLYTGNDTKMIFEMLDLQSLIGEEGVMIQTNSGHYHTKRTSDLFKAKKFKSADLKVIGFEEGENILTGKLGALIVDYKGNELRIGSGFSHRQRQAIWTHQEDYIGEIVEVKYQTESKNKQGKLSLQFATFVDFRWDKDEPSYED